MPKRLRSLRCPICKTRTLRTAPEFPFCSERCATLDLGAWADEKFKVPAVEQESDSVNENSDGESVPLVELYPKDEGT